MSDSFKDNLIEQIAGLESKTFSDAWTYAGIEAALRYDYNIIFTAEREVLGSLDDEPNIFVEIYRGGNDLQSESHPYNKEVVGYLISNAVAGETELLRIAISESMRGMGIGKNLMRAYMAYMSKHCGKSFLEVRSKNTVARRLYESMGFRAISIRKNYYSNPVEDAAIYECELNS